MPARPPLLATITARTPSATTATATITSQRGRCPDEERCGSSSMVFRRVAQACARLPEANLTVCERFRPGALRRGRRTRRWSTRSWTVAPAEPEPLSSRPSQDGFLDAEETHVGADRPQPLRSREGHEDLSRG